MTSTIPTAAPAKRMSSDERRAQIVDAARAVFGARGYEGTTTDQVAKAAGVSQPYVVRLFGTKEQLFLAALQDSLDRLFDGFRVALAADDGTSPEQGMGQAYVDLLQVRGLHQLLSHAFLLGGHPVIGPAARAGWRKVWRFLRDEIGMSNEDATGFLAHGMLINTLIGLRVADDYGDDDSATELYDACFPAEVKAVLATAPRADEPW